MEPILPEEPIEHIEPIVPEEPTVAKNMAANKKNTLRNFILVFVQDNPLYVSTLCYSTLLYAVPI